MGKMWSRPDQRLERWASTDRLPRRRAGLMVEIVGLEPTKVSLWLAKPTPLPLGDIPVKWLQGQDSNLQDEMDSYGLTIRAVTNYGLPWSVRNNHALSWGAMSIPRNFRALAVSVHRPLSRFAFARATVLSAPVHGCKMGAAGRFRHGTLSTWLRSRGCSSQKLLLR